MKQSKWLGNGFLLGIVFFISIFLVKPIGVSTQYSMLSGMGYHAVDPSIITEDKERESGYKSSNAYIDRHEGKLAKSIMDPINYDFIFVLAMPVGGFLAYLLNKRKGKEERVKLTRESYIIGFIGGFLLLFGARMADGCTSGHMMSGMTQGSVSGYIFAAVVFAVAIPTAIIKEIRKEKKGEKI